MNLIEKISKVTGVKSDHKVKSDGKPKTMTLTERIQKIQKK